MNPRDERDEWLMAQVALGHRDALEPLVRRYAGPLVGFIRRLVRDSHRGEELFQEVFLSVWQKRAQYQFPRPFKPWLYMIALNKCRADFRRRLANDEDLRGELEAARRGLALLESALPPAEADERLIQLTLMRIDAKEKRRVRLRKRLCYAALAPLVAAMLVIGLFHVHYNNLSASPANLEVYGQNRLMPDSDGALRVRLTDARTRAPIAGVPVDVTLGEPGSANFVTL